MIRQKTVFVVGAGTGVDYDMPVGSGLAQKIYHNLARTNERGYGGLALQDSKIEQLLGQMSVDEQKAKKAAADKIRGGVLLARSIDEFLDSFSSDQHVVEIGKCAIVSAILDAERKSKLFVSPENVYNKIDLLKINHGWLTLLFQLMTNAVKDDSPEKCLQNATFVNFNYDRCLEHFLHHALAGRFGLDLIAAKKLAAMATIVHPYGSLGNIDLLTGNSNNYFGHAPNIDLLLAAKGIRAYTEQIKDGDEAISKVKSAMVEAECLVFLGFAFHDQNLKLLASDRKFGAERVLATALGMSELDTSLTRSWINSQFDDGCNALELKPDTCAEFIRKHQKSIAN